MRNDVKPPPKWLMIGVICESHPASVEASHCKVPEARFITHSTRFSNIEDEWVGLKPFPTAGCVWPWVPPLIPNTLW